MRLLLVMLAIAGVLAEAQLLLATGGAFPELLDLPASVATAPSGWMGTAIEAWGAIGLLLIPACGLAIARSLGRPWWRGVGESAGTAGVLLLMSSAAHWFGREQPWQNPSGLGGLVGIVVCDALSRNLGAWAVPALASGLALAATATFVVALWPWLTRAAAGLADRAPDFTARQKPATRASAVAADPRQPSAFPLRADPPRKEWGPHGVEDDPDFDSVGNEGDDGEGDDAGTDIRINRRQLETLAARRMETVTAHSAASTIVLPTLDILDEPADLGSAAEDQGLLERAAVLEKTFAQFQMRVKVVQIDVGPVITFYEIELEPGLRAKRVIGLAEDLAIALKASSVRIVAPIPGKNTVGIEVPNERRVKVLLREVLAAGQQDAVGMRLPLFMGKDIKGLPLVCDLANLPHLLIAGRTGTGKSVCLNALIVSILLARTPEQVRMLMIDPKMVELSVYRDVPHLLHPVVTDMAKAEAILGWAVDQMEQRYELLSKVGVRHLDSFNKLSLAEIQHRLGDEAHLAASLQHPMPYILVFVDEMADLMMTSGREVEFHIIRLAQKSRAVGIHLVLATQKPTVDVITGLIKSNLPARISFQVASKMDSRVVLDEMGADKLLGNGDLLFLWPGTSKLIRAQGAYVSDDEVTRVAAFLSKQAKPRFAAELLALPSAREQAKESDAPTSAVDDELFIDAVEVVVRERRGSVSLLQRVFGIGYGRAARLIDTMAADGIVGEYNGSQAREVQVTPAQWEERKQRLRA